jgi:hypothetical protein
MPHLEFNSAKEILHWIRAEFERIPPAVLEDVFERWINRLEKYSQYEGNLFPED